MTVDEQIRDALAAVPLGDRPSADDRAAVDRAAVVGRRRRRTSRALLTVAAAGALVVVLAVVWPRPAPEVQTRGPVPTAVEADDGLPDGWRWMADPALDWWVAFPTEWTAQTFVDPCGLGQVGTILASRGDPPPFDDRVTGCTTARDWSGVAPDAVVIELTHRFGGPGGPYTGTTLPLVDTSFPLTVPPDESFDPSSEGPSHAQWSQMLVIDGDDRYWVTVWFGTGASAEDRADARRVVELLRPPMAPDPPVAGPTTTTDPSWRTVDLPRHAPQDGGPDALIEGALVAEGDCLYVRTRSGDRYAVVWSGDDVHMVLDASGALLDVVADGRSIGPLDAFRAGGGYDGTDVPARLPIDIVDLRDECRTPQFFVAN